MWIRKTDLEINNLLTQRESKKNSLKRPFIYGLIFGLSFFLFFYLKSFLHFYLRGGSVSVIFDNIFSGEPELNKRCFFIGIFAFSIVFGIALFRQKQGLEIFSDYSYLRCINCTELSETNPQKICACGGKLEPSEFYDWEEN